jgi:hypothetical protein
MSLQNKIQNEIQKIAAIYPDTRKYLVPILKKIAQSFNYKKEHGHDRCQVGSVPWYFHNYEHGYKHCSGGNANPYNVKHWENNPNIHAIDKEYARGHGINRNPTWFQFTEKLGDGWWDLDSGKEISVTDVPDRFKEST